MILHILSKGFPSNISNLNLRIWVVDVIMRMTRVIVDHKENSNIVSRGKEGMAGIIPLHSIKLHIHFIPVLQVLLRIEAMPYAIASALVMIHEDGFVR